MFNLSSTSCWFLVGVASLECWCCLISWCGRGKRVSDEPCHSKCLCNVFWDEVCCFRGSLFESFFGRSRISLAAYPENQDLLQDQFARVVIFDLGNHFSNNHVFFKINSQESWCLILKTIFILISKNIFKNLDPAKRLKIERLGKR